jgi:hypothetical protein
MGFLTPLSLLFAALSTPIIVFYMLKLRREDVMVSSTLLWQRLLRDREANTPWQRLRRNLLMLLQLLILALLTTALARPFFPTTTVVTGSVVILLDASASMRATDVSPSRFDTAREAARNALDGLGAGDVATLIAVGPQPVVLAAEESDRTILRRALDNATPSYGPADWEAAAALAAASLAGSEETRAIVISDGAMSNPLPPFTGDVRFVRVGASGDNLAILALAMREGPGGPQAFVRAANFGDALTEARISLHTDGIPFDTRLLTIPAHGEAGLTLDDLPYDFAVLEARLEPADPLPLDNVAWAVRSASANRRVLLITPGNLFLERAMSMLPGVELTRQAPVQPIADASYDLIVHDGPITNTLPPGNLWVIGPYGETTGVFTQTAVIRTVDDAILRYVDLEGVQILRAWRTVPPPGARVLVEAEGGPLLFVAERPEGRLAVLAFDLHQSDLPLRVAFPILIANLTRWLLPQGGLGDAAAHPGVPITIRPAAEAERIAVSAPDGEEYTLAVGEMLPVFADTDQLGTYRIDQIDGQDSVIRSDILAVNLFNADESDIAPRTTIVVGEAELGTAAETEEGRREFWPWLATAALAMLAIEWWVYHRGSRIG